MACRRMCSSPPSCLAPSRCACPKDRPALAIVASCLRTFRSPRACRLPARSGVALAPRPDSLVPLWPRMIPVGPRARDQPDARRRSATARDSRLYIPRELFVDKTLYSHEPVRCRWTESLPRTDTPSSLLPACQGQGFNRRTGLLAWIDDRSSSTFSQSLYVSGAHCYQEREGGGADGRGAS